MSRLRLAGAVDPATFKGRASEAPPPRTIRRVLRSTDKALTWGFAALLALAPLPYGGNSRFGWTLIAVATGALLALWGFRAALWRTRERDLPAVLVPALGLLALVVLWVALQTATFTPRPWHHPLWLATSEALGTDEVRAAITINAYETWTGLMRLLMYVGVFWLALQLARASGGARRIVLTLVIAGFAYAAYGLFAYFVIPDKILWFDKWYTMVGVHSTFINRNSYATYAGMGLLAAVGLAIVILARNRRALERQPSRRQRLVLGVKLVGWLVPVIVIVALALVLTSSRAGNAATAVGLAALIGSLGLTRLVNGRTAITSVLALTIVAGLILALAGDDLTNRLAGTDLEDEGRFPVYARIIEAIQDVPWTGTGFNTFAEGFRIYIGQLSELWWDQAHNTYLELAFELGVPATIVLLAAVLIPIGVCIRGLRERGRSALYPALALGVTTQVGLHALLDFSLEMPAIAVTYAAILGAGCARSLPSRRRRGALAEIVRRRWVAPGFALTLAGALLILGGARLTSHLAALPALVLKSQLEEEAVVPISSIDQAIEAARHGAAITDFAHLSWVEGRAALAQAHREGLPERVRGTWFERAEDAFRRSLGAAPANPAAWAQFAYVTLLTRPNSPLVARAVRLSVVTGSSFLPQLPLRAMVAAAVWDRLDRQTRDLYRAQFVYGMRHEPQRLAQALSRVRDVEMVRRSLRNSPGLLTQFDRMRPVMVPRQPPIGD